ncbi:hypothetical protein M413DRAFT_32384 [Hebeloma cylindrosporum]|uniref:F-box domain-containing protein n=1 Tax=Hebeloma cylindrosporum TaxID=76867 RepID=A0A0C3BW68_HEBCY|nr:hypothetical protein M413DRAFT_32384 [Hebeloma cylindrosporum h7]
MNANHDPFVLKLPPEIASHIFLLSMGDLDTPYVFGSVCRGWRQLARSTPQLWSTLAFSPPRRMDSTLMETVPHLVVDWLERSGGLPLSLDVSYFVSNSAGFPQEVLLSIINAVSQHSGRWQDVCFNLPVAYLPVAYLQYLCPISPPKDLQKFSICGTGNADAAVTYTPRFAMNTTGPMEFMVDSIPLMAFDIAWDRLVQLDVWRTSLDGFPELIRGAPLLEKCTLVALFLPTADVSETIIRSPHLRTLELYDLRKDVFTELMNLLELPSLESWSFDSVGEDVITENAISFLRRSNSGLQTLEFYQDQAPSFEDFQRLLQAAPRLQCLKLGGDGLLLDYILEELSTSPSHPTSPTGNNAGFLSKLQSLEFFDCSGLSAWECIPLIFRWPHRKLLSLDIKVDSVIISDEVSSELVQLVDQGIKLRIYDLSIEEDYLQRFRERTECRN